MTCAGRDKSARVCRVCSTSPLWVTTSGSPETLKKELKSCGGLLLSPPPWVVPPWGWPPSFPLWRWGKIRLDPHDVAFSCHLSFSLSHNFHGQVLFWTGFWFIVFVPSDGRRHMPQEQKTKPSSTCFRQDWQWTVLDLSPSSCNSILPNSWIVRLDSLLNLMDFPVFPESSMIDLAWCSVRNLSTTFWIWPILSSMFLKKWLNTSHLFPDAPSFWVVCWGTLALFPHQNSPMLSCCCCCCCDCQALLRTFFGASRGVESLSCWVLSPFEKSLCRCDLPAQSCRQLRHRPFSASIVLFFLVFGLNWSSRRRPAEASTCCDSVLFSTVVAELFLRLDCPPTGWEVWRRRHVVPLYSLFLQLSVLTWGLKWHHKSIHGETRIRSIWME